MSLKKCSCRSSGGVGLKPDSDLRPVSGGGAFSGLGNKIREENGRWWHTRRWLVQTGLWLLIINGISMTAYFQLRGDPATYSWAEMVGIFTGLMGWMVAFGVIILTQGDVVEEKQLGTAEWVLSSPLSKLSFILSKVLVDLAWLLVIVVVLQGAVFAILMNGLGAGVIGWSDLILGLGLQGLALAFWLCLSIMLGTFFKSRNPVIGVPLVFLFLQSFIPRMFGSLSDSVSLFLPARLPEYSTNAFTGSPIPSMVPVITVAILCFAFVTIAILRFNKEEFAGS